MMGNWKVALFLGQWWIASGSQAVRGESIALDVCLMTHEGKSWERDDYFVDSVDREKLVTELKQIIDERAVAWKEKIDELEKAVTTLRKLEGGYTTRADKFQKAIQHSTD